MDVSSSSEDELQHTKWQWIYDWLKWYYIAPVVFACLYLFILAESFADSRRQRTDIQKKEGMEDIALSTVRGIIRSNEQNPTRLVNKKVSFRINHWDMAVSTFHRVMRDISRGVLGVWNGIVLFYRFWILPLVYAIHSTV